MKDQRGVQLYMVCECGVVALDADEVNDFAQVGKRYCANCKECGRPMVEKEPDYLNVCPICRNQACLKGCVIECDIPITTDGWAYTDSPFMNSSEEVFWCDECDLKVPNGWVMGTLSRGQAMAIMKRPKRKGKKGGTKGKG
jgi:hypothetical protein